MDNIPYHFEFFLNQETPNHGAMAASGPNFIRLCLTTRSLIHNTFYIPMYKSNGYL